eukprot:CAMPEP_0201887780 /NCGR_PEP_ID=MMETSP0902-20130614/25843_1 /ASSEMBLY_ACC=CAM_ASM_000551 /TAXON_ID=420261 /ORGANISM="Thalassiosira antarctica, Strain CCMP982" /LENGTH=128 /DNA_ID=CAMNT_0048417813 /DNA_START=85 /DNA_END=471 /DNA_ORIENTATION=+
MTGLHHHLLTVICNSLVKHINCSFDTTVILGFWIFFVVNYICTSTNTFLEEFFDGFCPEVMKDSCVRWSAFIEWTVKASTICVMQRPVNQIWKVHMGRYVHIHIIESHKAFDVGVRFVLAAYKPFRHR